MEASMKKLMIFLLAALLAVCVCACASSENSSVYTVTRNGTDYTVNQENGTISDGTYTYQYTLSGNSSGYSISITYPDGSTYWWSEQTSSGGLGLGSGGWSDDYDENRYVSGDVLCGILEAGVPASRQSSPGNVLIGIVLLGLGLFNIISPHTAWYLRNGWRYQDVEPSDLALGVTRGCGVACVIFAIVILIVM